MKKNLFSLLSCFSLVRFDLQDGRTRPLLAHCGVWFTGTWIIPVWCEAAPLAGLCYVTNMKKNNPMKHRQALYKVIILLSGPNAADFSPDSLRNCKQPVLGLWWNSKLSSNQHQKNMPVFSSIGSPVTKNFKTLQSLVWSEIYSAFKTLSNPLNYLSTFCHVKSRNFSGCFGRFDLIKKKIY